MGGAVLGGGGGIHFEIWEVPFRDMGGAEMSCGKREDIYVVLVA